MKEATEEGEREIDRANKNLPPEKPLEVEKSAKEISDIQELKAAKKRALKDEAIAMKKEDMAKQALENASTKEEIEEAKEALK